MDKTMVVIGGGPGGYVAAIKAAQLGFKVTCIEKRGALGGTCLNVGCIPSKALLQASHEYFNARKHFSKLGLKSGENVTFNLPEIMKHKEGCIQSSSDGIEHLFKKYKVEYVKGEGSLAGPHEVRVKLMENPGESRTLKAGHIILATGSDVFTLPSMPIDEQTIVSSTGALSFDKVPKRLVVVGAGVIGLELGSVWSRLGTQVSVVELTPHCIPEMDRDLGTALQRLLTRQGMKFHMQSMVTGIQKKDGAAIVSFDDKKGKQVKKNQIVADKVLIAIGRAPYTKNLGLKELGIQTDRRGFIAVDGRYRTCVPSVYAIGDAIPGPMLAHKAEEDGVACVEMIAKRPGAQPVDYSLIPGVVYTHPEVAAVGKTEDQLKKEGVAYRKGVFPYMANGRARANADMDGFVKILADKKTDRILGVHTIGGVAGEAIAEAVVAMHAGWTAGKLGETCHAHPTLSEAIKEAALAAHHLPIHM